MAAGDSGQEAQEHLAELGSDRVLEALEAVPAGDGDGDGDGDGNGNGGPPFWTESSSIMEWQNCLPRAKPSVFSIT